MSRFVKKPDGEWKSEELFRTYCSLNKIDIVMSQPLICKLCGSMPARDVGGKCVVCGGQDFTRPDFLIRGIFPVNVHGSIHEKQKVEERDLENHEALVNRGRLPIDVWVNQLKRAMGK